MSDAQDRGPYDFGELAHFDAAARPVPEAWPARDGTPLAVRVHQAASDLVVIALHGSSAEGRHFHPLATRLRELGRAAVYVPDLRGHGASGGRRGDVDYVGQPEDDLSDLLHHREERRPGSRRVLLGHASGGGLVVRFAGGRRADRIAGHLLLAPFLGGTAPTTRPASGGWARADGARIVELATRAARGDTSGQDQIVLRFNMPAAQRTGREVLEYSFRMMIAYQPRPDLDADLAGLRQPLLGLAGSLDESFHPERYEPTISPHAKGTFKVLPGARHLGLAVDPRTADEVDGWLGQLPS
jgi:alpha-beta hydrolase superfamily lysophospholipase